jgi:uncharacterized protein
MWRFLLFTLVTLSLLSCAEDEAGNVSQYDEQEVLEARQAKDEAFRSGSASPLPADKRESFAGLKYFDPDERYVVEATFSPASKAEDIVMQTSTGEPRKAIRARWFTFTIDGRKLKLSAYTFDGSEGTSFFVPFTDRTTGHETYYAGRYLDIPKIDGDQYIIDFNDAYNPYCAYSEAYSCPLVPSENELSVAIRAGEKK